jgi:multicomponent Na+:H+ antiporter subunit E
MGRSGGKRPGRGGSMLLFAWLVVMWTALWGVPTLANLLGGAVVASVVL